MISSEANSGCSDLEKRVERNSFYNPLLKSSHIEVFCGPMNSRKSMGLLQALDSIDYMGNANYVLFKPDTDTRNGPYITTRFGQSITKKDCTFIDYMHPEKMFDYITDKYNVVGIDELQFFDKGSKLSEVLEEMRNRGMYIIASGLDMNFRGEPFNEMPNVLAIANEVHKNFAVCEYDHCDKPAYFTQRLINGEPAHYDSPLILVGDDEEGYQARCKEHHIVPGRPRLIVSGWTRT